MRPIDVQRLLARIGWELEGLSNSPAVDVRLVGLSAKATAIIRDLQLLVENEAIESNLDPGLRELERVVGEMARLHKML